MANRSDIRGRARDYLYEQAAETVKLWTDTQLNPWITEEMRSLPSEVDESVWLIEPQ